MTLTAEERIECEVRAFERRRRLMRAANLAILGFGVGGLWTLAGIVGDRLLGLNPTVRWTNLLLEICVCVGMWASAARMALQNRVDLTQASRRIEKYLPKLETRLTTLVTQSQMPVGVRASGPLRHALAEQVASVFESSRPSDCITFGSLRSGCVLLCTTVVLGIVVTLAMGEQFPILARREAAPWITTELYTRTRIDLQPTPIAVVPGANVSIEADISPADSTPMLWAGPSPEQSQPLAMNRSSGARYGATIASLQTKLYFQVRAGDSASAWQTIDINVPPTITNLDVALTMPDGTINQSRHFSGMLLTRAGTPATVTVTANEPLADATLAIDGLKIPTVPGASSMERRAKFVIEQSASWSIELISASGAIGRGPSDLRIEVLPPAATQVYAAPRLAPGYEGAIGEYFKSLNPK